MTYAIHGRSEPMTRLSARLARKKPTYIIEHSGATTMKSIYEGIWAAATVIVKF